MAFTIETIEYVAFDDTLIDFANMKSSFGWQIRSLTSTSSCDMVWQRFYGIDGRWIDLRNEDQILLNKAYRFWQKYQAEKILLLSSIEE